MFWGESTLSNPSYRRICNNKHDRNSSNIRHRFNKFLLSILLKYGSLWRIYVHRDLSLHDLQRLIWLLSLWGIQLKQFLFTSGHFESWKCTTLSHWWIATFRWHMVVFLCKHTVLNQLDKRSSEYITVTYDQRCLACSLVFMLWRPNQKGVSNWLLLCNGWGHLHSVDIVKPFSGDV